MKISTKNKFVIYNLWKNVDTSVAMIFLALVLQLRPISTYSLSDLLNPSGRKILPYFSESVSTPVQSIGTPLTM
jgi:hypothetical protein